jgi:hypothetical protein
MTPLAPPLPRHPGPCCGLNGIAEVHAQGVRVAIRAVGMIGGLTSRWAEPTLLGRRGCA